MQPMFGMPFPAMEAPPPPSLSPASQFQKPYERGYEIPQHLSKPWLPPGHIVSQEDDKEDKDFGFGPGQGSTLPGYNP